MISVDGIPLAIDEQRVYLLLNKPCGYVTTLSDEKGRPTVSELVSDCGVRVYPVGRLDLNSEGLLLMTNDGEFADRITHPGNGVFKTYAVSVEHPFTDSELKQMCSGITHEGETLHAEDIYRTGPRKYLIVLMEGKNREIRRMVEYLGNEVNRLERVVIGNLKRGLLKPGQWRFMSKKDIALALNVEITDPEMKRFPPDLLREQLKTGTPSASFCKRKPNTPKRKDD